MLGADGGGAQHERARIGAALLDGAEFDSVIRLAQSQVDVSLRRLLQTHA